MRERARNEGEARTKKKFLSRPNLSSFFDINLHNFTSLAARGSEERRTTPRALCFSIRSSGSSAYLYGRPSWFHMYRVSPWDRSPWLLPGDEYEIYFEAQWRLGRSSRGEKLRPGPTPSSIWNQDGRLVTQNSQSRPSYGKVGDREQSIPSVAWWHEEWLQRRLLLPSYLINCKIQNRVWKGVRISAPFSRQSRNPNLCHLYLGYRFLSQYRIPCQDFGESRFPNNGWIPYPVKSRNQNLCHPHPEYRFLSEYRILCQDLANPASRVTVKSYIPSRIFICVFPNPALYFGQIPKIPLTSASSGGLSKYNTIINDQSTFLIFLLLYTWTTLNVTTPEEEQIPT